MSYVVKPRSNIQIILSPSRFIFMQNFKSATTIINSDHPDIKSLATELTKLHTTTKQKAIASYNKVRDNWKYNPYNI